MKIIHFGCDLYIRWLDEQLSNQKYIELTLWREYGQGVRSGEGLRYVINRPFLTVSKEQGDIPA